MQKQGISVRCMQDLFVIGKPDLVPGLKGE
jgi:hypothetical protein